MGRVFTHDDLVKIAYQWVLNNGSCGFAFMEFVCHNNTGEIPDVIGFGSWQHTVVIEVKVSRSDFLCDKKKKFRKNAKIGMGKLRYFCCPSGLIQEEELPEGWGLIWVNEKGRATCVKRPVRPHSNPEYAANGSVEWYYHEHNIAAETAVMYSALRRLALRGLLKHAQEDLKEFNNDITTHQNHE